MFCWIEIYGKDLAEEKHEIKKCKMSWGLYSVIKKKKKKIGGLQLSNRIELIKIIYNVLIDFILVEQHYYIWL